MLSLYRTHDDTYFKYSGTETTWEKAAPTLGRETWDTGCK
jgi:hypothetical protein